MLGRHDGIIHFTVGQRRGLGIAAGASALCGAARRRLAARRGRAARGAAHAAACRLRDVNWLGDGTHRSGAVRGLARGVRQGALDPAAAAGLARAAGAGGIEVDLVAGEDGVSPGQACVFYDARRRPGARARRRLHPQRGCGGGALARAGRVGSACGLRCCRLRCERRGAMAGEIDIDTVAKAYARWAPVYDLVFGAVFDAGRKASIAAAERDRRAHPRCRHRHRHFADRLFAGNNRIVGVDYCEPMLRKAHERVAEHKLANVEALAVMDAQHLGFPDASSTRWWRNTSSPRCPTRRRRSTRFARVTKPGGEIILVNHLGAESGPAARLRAVLCADGAPARLAAGIPLGASRAMGRRRMPACALLERRADAAARAFLADPVCADGGATAPRRSITLDRDPVCMTA